MAKATPKPKGKGLKNKKVLYVGGGVLLILLYLYYKHKNSSTPATDTTANTGVVPLTTVTPQQAASAGTPSPNTPPSQSIDPATLDALGMGNNDYVTSTDLASQLGTLQDNIQASVAGLTFATPTSQMTPNGTSNQKVASTATKTSAIKYYTYAPGKAPKNQVKNQAPIPKAGQTLHFTKGKGYYLA